MFYTQRMSMTIGDLAVETGVKPSTIRFYETNSGSNVQLLSTMLEFFASLKEDVGNKPSDEDLAELKEDLDRHMAIAKFHATIKKRGGTVSDLD